jgi:flagellar basal-body rod protein FlgB
MPLSGGLFDGTVGLLQRTMNLRSAEHQALSSNIANADTPRYKAFEVAVEEELRKLRKPEAQLDLLRTDSAHIPPAGAAAGGAVRLKQAPEPEFCVRADGNTVDLDRTMGALAENSIKYKISAQLISTKLKILRSVIIGGR